MPGSLVLDLGCGSGSLLDVPLLRSNCRIIGVDNAWKMCRMAHEAGLAAVNASATAMPFSDETFDTCVSSFLFHGLDDPDLNGTLAEIWRVLKPEGKLVFAMLNADTVTPVATQYSSAQTATFQRAMRLPHGVRFHSLRIKAGGSEHLPAPVPFYERPLSTYLKAFQAAGLRMVDLGSPVLPHNAKVGAELLDFWKLEPFICGVFAKTARVAS